MTLNESNVIFIGLIPGTMSATFIRMRSATCLNLCFDSTFESTVRNAVNTKEGSFTYLFRYSTILDEVHSRISPPGSRCLRVLSFCFHHSYASAQICILNIEITRFPKSSEQLLPLVFGNLVEAFEGTSTRTCAHLLGSNLKVRCAMLHRTMAIVV